MSSCYGKNLKLSIFGESHGAAIGCVIDGFPAGMAVDAAAVRAFMARRAPGSAPGSTRRRETDEFEILSGIFQGVTCGTPIAAMIRNGDAHSSDYSTLAAVPRPGHADFTQAARYGAAADLRGGGHASGRLTAPLCFAGALAIQWLSSRGVSVSAHVASINGRAISGDCGPDGLDDEARAAIESARSDGDSVGGTVACRISGLPAGLGAPIFDGVENRIASIVFGIPAVKGIEFGNGFGAASLRGSQNNDAFVACADGGVRTATNNHGGVLGGISSGMDVLFAVAFKPTPSIAAEQRTADIERRETVALRVKGRHDACIVPRAAAAVEAAAAVAAMDIMLDPEARAG